MKNLLKSFAENSKNLKKSIIESSQFKTPVNSLEFNKSLKGDYFASSIFDYLSRDRSYREILDIYADFENLIIRNPSMNPNKDYFPKTYYKWQSNLKNDFDLIIEDITINKSRFNRFIHLGEKGGGKTITQNCWLHENNSLLEANKVFWVRCDVHKIYQLMEQSDYSVESSVEIVSIEQYLQIQFLYVFVKYIDKSNLFIQIFNEVQQENPKYSSRSNKGNLIERKSVTIIEGIKTIQSQLETEKGKQIGYSFAIDLIKGTLNKNNVKRFAFDFWIDLSTAIQSFILSRGYKLLNIIDGLDNVEFLNKTGLEYYKKLVTNAASFIATNPDPNVYKFIAIRPDTFADIRKALSASTDPQGFNAHYFTVQHKSPELETILQKRLKVFFSEIYTQNTTNSKTATYIEILKSTFNIHEINFDNLDFFNGNIRLFLHNRLSLTLQILFRYLQVGKQYDEKTFKSYYEINQKRNYLLNGRFFQNTETAGFNNIKQGNAIYNIFYFDYHKQDADNLKWGGLCTTRIMQYIHRNSDTSIDKIKAEINKNFSYGNDFIDKALSRLLSYGLISSFSSEDFYSVLYKLTAKGSKVLNLIFEDLDILHFLALDSPLPSGFFENSFVRPHRNQLIEENIDENIPTRTYYASSSIITVTSFILLLHNIHQQETETFSGKLKNIYREPFEPRAKMKIFQRMKSLYQNASAVEKQTIEDYWYSIGLRNSVLSLVKRKFSEYSD